MKIGHGRWSDSENTTQRFDKSFEGDLTEGRGNASGRKRKRLGHLVLIGGNLWVPQKVGHLHASGHQRPGLCLNWGLPGINDRFQN